MPGKKLMSIAAASIMGLSIAATEARANSLNAWEGFGIGLLAAPLAHGITRPILGGLYAPFGGYDGRRHLCRG